MLWRTGSRFYCEETSYQDSRGFVCEWETGDLVTGPRRVRRLNASGVWDVSRDGKMLCGMMREDPRSKGSFIGSSRPLRCYLLGNGDVVWELEPLKREYFKEVHFSARSDLVFVLTQIERRGFIRIIETSSGTELHRLPMPLEWIDVKQGSQYLAAVDDGILVAGGDSAPLQLLHLSPESLEFEPVKLKDTPQEAGTSVNTSPDGRWAIVYHWDGYEILRRTRGGWESMYAGVSDSITCAEFSPDSRIAFLSTSKEVRALDLETGVVEHSESEGAKGGAYAPDGRHVFGIEHTGFCGWKTSGWERMEFSVKQTQHDCPVQGFEFYPDGSAVVTWDHNFGLLWTLPEGRLVKKLTVGSEFPNLTKIVVANHGNDLMGSFNYGFAKWSSKFVSDSDVAVEDYSLAFSSIGRDMEMCANNDIHSLFEGTSIISIQDRQCFLRRLENPDVVRALPGLSRLSFPRGLSQETLSEQRSVFWRRDLCLELDLETGVAGKTLERRDGEAFVGWLRKGDLLVSQKTKSLEILQRQDGATIHSIPIPDSRLRFATVGDGESTVVSPDGALAASFMVESSTGGLSLALCDLRQRKWVSKIPFDRITVSAMRFSPDGAMLLLGHADGTSTLWDTARMRESSFEPFAAEVVQKVRAIPSRTEIYSPPPKPLRDDAGALWTFHDDATVSVEGCVGRFPGLRIEGEKQDVISWAMTSYRKNSGESVESLGYRNYIASGSRFGESLYVDRSLSVTTDSVKSGRMVDMLVNTGSEPSTFKVSMCFELPSETSGLTTSNGAEISIPEDGYFSLDNDVFWLAPQGRDLADRSVACIQVRSLSERSPPRLHFDKQSKVLMTNYEISLKAAEARYLVTKFAVETASPDGRVRADPPLSDVCTGILPAVQAAGVNFGPFRPDIPFRAISLRRYSSFEDVVYQTDALGFRWEADVGLSRTGELGVVGGLQLWSDHLPMLAMAGSIRSSQSSTPNDLVPEPQLISLRFHNDPSTTVIRRSQQNPENTAQWIYDQFVNLTDKPKAVPVSYMVRLERPIRQIVGARGEVWSGMDDFIASDYAGEFFGIELEGDQRPGILLSTHDAKSILRPTVRKLGDQVLILDYAFDLDPKKTAWLVHGISQRPLSAFVSASDAFVDWLPPPDPYNQFNYPSRTGGVAKSMVTNVLNRDPPVVTNVPSGSQ